MEYYSYIARASDRALLDRLVFSTGFESLGVVTLKSFIENFGVRRFERFFVTGEIYWSPCALDNEISDGFVPEFIYDLKSEKRIVGKGALEVYKRYTGWKDESFRHFHFRRGRGGWMRHPKTIAAIRAARFVDQEEGEPQFSGKQRSFSLTAWDDLWRLNQKCWKSHRKTQYK